MARPKVGELAMTKLSALHKRLAELRRRRRLIRWGTGYAAMAVALVWILAGLFVADWLLEMNSTQRGVAIILALGTLVWAFQRYTRPWLGHRETELDIALLVEKKHAIDTDLVAALQFERPEAQRWGSVQLEEQVIDYTSQVGTHLDVRHDISKGDLNRRAATLALSAMVLAVIAWLFPEYMAAFLDRLLLRNRHYPSQTAIQSVLINGHKVDIHAWRPQPVMCPYGQPVRFEVTCSGDLPPAGHASLKSTRGGLQTSVTLEATNKPQGTYRGTLPRLVDSVNYQLFLGDAWTDPAKLMVVPLPSVDVELEVTPPSYAHVDRTAATGTTGLRYVSVIEGSRVTARIVSDSPLRDATFSVDDKPLAMVSDGSKPSQNGEQRWVLKPEKTPLESVAEPIRYSIQVTDMHNLRLERPIQGVIRIKADLRPRVTGSLLTRFVLPTARPTIVYKAADDYGLAKLSIIPEVVHENGTTETAPEVVIFERKDSTPRRDLQDRYRLDLTPLKTVKGDQIKLTLQAVDYRGSQPGKATSSEPLVLQVTDEQGILAAMAETDKESARQLQNMIQRQIDVGEGP
jgi:hypothetical protein